MPQVEAAVSSATGRGVRSGIFGCYGFTAFFLSKQHISNLVRQYPLPRLHHHNAGQRSVAIDKENSVPERDARQGLLVLHENVGTYLGFKGMSFTPSIGVCLGAEIKTTLPGKSRVAIEIHARRRTS